VSGSDEQPEEFERAFPFSGVHGLELGVDERERPGQGDADAAEEQREPVPGRETRTRRVSGEYFEPTIRRLAPNRMRTERRSR
jgi:hypothetical protein